MSRRKRWALILLAAAAVCLAAELLVRGTAQPSSHIGVFQNGELLLTIDTRTTAPREYRIDGENGAFNTIAISADGSIRITEASCNDKTCVRRGELGSGAPIVCLPNRIVVKYIGSSLGSAYDAVTN